MRIGMDNERTNLTRGSQKAKRTTWPAATFSGFTEPPRPNSRADIQAPRTTEMQLRSDTEDSCCNIQYKLFENGHEDKQLAFSTARSSQINKCQNFAFCFFLSPSFLKPSKAANKLSTLSNSQFALKKAGTPSPDSYSTKRPQTIHP